jgi:predicted RecA/RadA family phage recombinase
MAKNADFIKTSGDLVECIQFVAGADINTGEIALVEDTYVIAYQDKLSGGTLNGVYACNMCEVPKATGTGKTFAIGDQLWLDTSALTVHKTQATGDVYVGLARAAATAAATHVLADFDGRTGR